MAVIRAPNHPGVLVVAFVTSSSVAISASTSGSRVSQRASVNLTWTRIFGTLVAGLGSRHVFRAQATISFGTYQI